MRQIEEKTSESTDGLILQSAIRISVLELIEPKDQPIGKYNYTKDVVNESMFYQYGNYGLPRPLFPNIHKRGIYPTDFDRTINEDPLITKNSKTYYIEPENRQIIREEALNYLSPSNIDYIKNKMKNLRTRHGEKLHTSVFGTNDLALSQLNKYILNRAKQYINWYINPKHIDYISTISKSISKSAASNLPIVAASYEKSDQITKSSTQTVIDDSCVLISNMIKQP